VYIYIYIDIQRDACPLLAYSWVMGGEKRGWRECNERREEGEEG
jgi:hypothetical protein